MNFSMQYPLAARKLIDNSYMDDILDSCETESELLKTVEHFKIINNHAGFELHSWASNCQSVLSQLGITQKSDDNLFTSSETNVAIGKVLGLRWLSETDLLTFNLNLSKIPNDIILGRVRPTKRDYLKLLMSIFDPLGFLSPFFIQARFIFQDICERRVKWGELINDSEFAAWINWLSYFCQIALTKLNRCYQLPSFQTKVAELFL